MSLELEGFEVDEDQLNPAMSDVVGALNEATFAQVACFSELPTQMEPDSSPPSASASTHPIEADRRHATGAVLREQDRLLPLSIIARLMAQEVPKDAKISRDAKRFMQESASEFICFVTSEANDVALSERDRLHKTISSENILTALRNIDLASFEPPMNMARSLTDFGVKDESSSKSKRPRDHAPARDGTLCTSSVDSCASSESSEGSFKSRCSREGDDSFTANQAGTGHGLALEQMHGLIMNERAASSASVPPATHGRSLFPQPYVVTLPPQASCSSLLGPTQGLHVPSPSSILLHDGVTSAHPHESNRKVPTMPP